MKRVKIISDYTPLDEPNQLNIIQDDQGDIHINMVRNSESERGVRVAASGTRYSWYVRNALYRLVKALEENEEGGSIDELDIQEWEHTRLEE